jgi:hypothetical protein
MNHNERFTSMPCKLCDKSIPQVAKRQLIQALWTRDPEIDDPTLNDSATRNSIYPPTLNCMGAVDIIATSSDTRTTPLKIIFLY